MSDISDLMAITRRKIVPKSRFESSNGMDEKLLDSMQDDLPQDLTMGLARQKLHPTVSELWICDTGCGIQFVLPYVVGSERLSKGETLIFPALRPEDILSGAPHKQEFSARYHEITEAITLDGRVKVYGIDGIGADVVKVAGEPNVDGNYFYASVKYSPIHPNLSDLSVGYGQVRNPILQIDIKYNESQKLYITTGIVTAHSKLIDCSIELRPDGSVKPISFNGNLPDNVSSVDEYITKLAEGRKLEGMYCPLLNGHKVDFYKTIRALVELGVHSKGDLNKVLKFTV